MRSPMFARVRTLQQRKCGNKNNVRQTGKAYHLASNVHGGYEVLDSWLNLRYT